MKLKLEKKKSKKKGKKKKGDDWELDENSDHPVHEKYTSMGSVKK
jgi:hypothetical protein